MSGATPFLRQVAADLEAAGAMPGQDFVVHFVTTDVASGDNVGLRPSEAGFEVYYNERGDRRVLLATADPEQARALLVERALELARQHSGSGPA